MMVAGMLTLGWILGGCASPPPAPARDFTPRDLLIDPSLLPPGWTISSGPSDRSAHSMGLSRSLGGSDVELRAPGASASHRVARFSSVQDAAQSYADHNYTRNTEGTYASTWIPLDLAYASPLAQQYRVVCERIRNTANSAPSCVIEAQYQEFLSVVFYSTSDPQRTEPELEVFAAAVDARMGQHLVK